MKLINSALFGGSTDIALKEIKKILVTMSMIIIIIMLMGNSTVCKTRDIYERKVRHILCEIRCDLVKTHLI